MNVPLRKVAIAMLVLFGLLILNANYVQVLQADKLSNDDSNTRILLSEYGRDRGGIVVSGKSIATSKATDDRLKYLRSYPNGPVYAPVTGAYSLVYGATGIEKAENDILSGEDDRLIRSKVTELFTGRDPRGGNAVLTIDDQVQQVAYKAMAKQTGAVVALDPRSGEILSMVSTPSYDPNKLTSHDPKKIRSAYDSLIKDPTNPMLNRAISQKYPPGSVFKVVVSAAALSQGRTPESTIDAPDVLTLPHTNTQLHNFGNSSCSPDQKMTMIRALTISCNTAFAQLGIDLGADTVRQQAEKFGLDRNAPDIPLDVADSQLGEIPDQAALGQSAIGQRDVAMTPLQAAMIAAAVANKGELMKPHLVKELQAPNLTTLDRTDSKVLANTMSPEVADQLTRMMVSVVDNGSGRRAQIPGVSVAGKTGTAENAKGQPPHAWFVGFAPAEHPTVAVAVLIEHGGDSGSETTGGEAAAPIARSVIQAALASQGAR